MSVARFEKIVKDNFKTLDLYTTAITRAHGKSHPEAFEVRELFETMNEKVNETEQPDLSEEFIQLREVTDNYKIPDDVCETYAGVYNMLSEADNVFHTK